MLKDPSSGNFLLTDSLSATNAWVWFFDDPNKNSLHKDDDRMYYCYKRETISRDVGLGSWDSGPKILQRGKKSKSTSNAFIFLSGNFWSIGRYIYYFNKLCIEPPGIIPRIESKRNDQYWKIPIHGNMLVWFWKWG